MVVATLGTLTVQGENMAERYPFCAEEIAAFEAHRGQRVQTRGLAPEARRTWNDQLRQLQQAYQRCVSGVAQARQGHRFDTEPVRFVRADNRHIVTLSDGGYVTVWNRATGRARSQRVNDAAWLSLTESGDILLAGRSASQTLDAITFEQVALLSSPQVQVAGERRLAVNLRGDSLQMLATPEMPGRGPMPIRRTFGPLTLSPDGGYAWNGTQLVQLVDQGPSIVADFGYRPRPAAFSRRALLIAHDGGELHHYALANMSERVYRLPAWRGVPVAVAVRADGGLAAVAERGGRVSVFDLQTQQSILTYDHADEVTDLQFAGMHLLSSSRDGSVHLSAGEESLGELVSFASGGWAVLTPAGYYDAPEGGAGMPLRWYAYERELLLEQLAAGFWKPALLGALLAGDAAALPAPEPLDVPPEVRISAPENGSVRLQVEGDPADLGQVQVLLNGKEIHMGALAEGELLLPAKAIMRGASNVLETRAWNSAGTVTSRGSRVTWVDSGQPAPEPPTLHLLAIGVSDYDGADIDLQFAALDAQRFAQAVRSAGSELLGTTKVRERTLLDATANPAALRAAFAELADSRAEDLLVVYLAGHGVSQGDEYYFLTAGAERLEAVPGSAVSSGELVQWLRAVPARKQVMVLDTCAAGAVRNRLSTPRGIPAAQSRALTRLRQRTGFHVIMGSAADSVSFEASRFGQGLLTYALLEGMRGPALRAEGMVDVSTLFQYAVDRVPELARDLGGVQQPLIFAPDGASFDIGRVTESVRQDMPLAELRPLLLAPTFVSAEQGYDVHGLGARFRSLLSARSRGGDVVPVVLFVDSLPGALTLSGIYSDAGGGVQLTATLLAGERVISRIQLHADSVDAAAQSLLDRLVALLQQAEGAQVAG